MKKNHILFLILIISFLLINTSNAQILNPSFETWEDQTPTNWVTSNTPLLTNVTFTPDSHDGSLSVQMQIKDFNGLPVAASLTTEHTNSLTGHPVNERYGILKGYLNRNFPERADIESLF